MHKEEGKRKGTYFFSRLVLVAGVVIGVLLAAQLLVVESADAAGFSTEPPAGDSLLEDHFGVTPELIPQSGGRYSFDRDSLIPPAEIRDKVGWTEIDWFGTWSFDNWETTTVWGTEPSGAEWYDVEAMYVDNDADNIYVAIITSCPFNKPDWDSEPGVTGSHTGLGIYEPRYEEYPVYPWIVPGDLCIDLGLQPRDEKGTLATSYDYGIDIVHERRNPKDGDGPAVMKDATQHTISSIRDTNVGYKLYKTTADPGGSSIGDPYIDLGTSPKYDWYTASLHEKSEWQHTNFDPLSTWGTQPSARGDATVYYYKYEFPGGIRENNADTYVIEATIPRALFGADDPAPGDIVGFQWVTACRNEGVTTASISTQISGTIGDLVWNDEDEDGCQDVDEDGIEGVTVELWQPGGVAPVATDVTDSDGLYSFDADAGDYYIKFEKPTGWIFTSKDACADTSDSDADVTTGETDVFTFEPTLANPDDLTRDAGLYGERAEIGDLVWRDTDGDGKQDSGEPGIGGVTVKLFESGNPTPVATTTTASDGTYLFEVSPGDYYLSFTAPSGYFFTIKDVSGNTFDLIDSDAGPSGMTAVTTLTGGDSQDWWDCGLYQKGTIGDFVWEDLDGDGVQDPGEPGIEGVFVNLYKWSGDYVSTTNTDADGLYSFTVRPGAYYVKFNPGSQYTYSPRDVGNDGKDSDPDTTGKTAQITITSGEIELKWDAGLIRDASLGDYVWEDFNGDGVQDAGEAGLSGIQVELYESGNPTPIATDTTDSTGEYLFDDLLPGDYYVVVPLPADYFYSPRYQDGYTLDSNVNETGHSELVSLSSGEANLTIDAGLMPRPETRKEFYGTIYYNGILTHHLSAVDNEYEEYITPDTIIYLNYTNPDVLNQTMYRIWRMNAHGEWVLLFDWMNTTTGASMGYYPINLSAIGADYGYPCSGLYQIEFYSIDIYGNVESLLWNNVYVDCTPPTSLKTYGDPSVTAWDRQEWMHWIGPMTPITITGDDGMGSGTREIWYQIYYPNGTLYTEPDKPGDFTLYTGPIHVSGPDGIYHIYYKAMDQLNNTEQLRKQRFILDNDFPLGDQSQMWFTPSPAEVDVGAAGSIDIAINASTPLSGLQCSLSFDPAMIHIDSIEVPFPLNSSGTIDNVNGMVTGIFGAYETGNISATQIFATIHFTARNYTGDTMVTLTDVVAVDEDDNPVTILAWPGTITVTGAPPSCPFDINGDDVVDILDIVNVSSWFGWQGPAGSIPQDVSGPQSIPDGEVNIFDIVAVARHWGPCP